MAPKRGCDGLWEMGLVAVTDFVSSWCPLLQSFFRFFGRKVMVVAPMVVAPQVVFDALAEFSVDELKNMSETQNVCQCLRIRFVLGTRNPVLRKGYKDLSSAAKVEAIFCWTVATCTKRRPKTTVSIDLLFVNV